MILSVTRQEMKYLGGMKIMSFINIKKLILKQRRNLIHRKASGGSIKLSNNLTIVELSNALQMLSEEGFALRKLEFFYERKRLELTSININNTNISLIFKEDK